MNVAGFPPLKVLDFETGQIVEPDSSWPLLQTQTVESITLFFDDQPASLEPQVDILSAGIGMGVQISNQIDLHPFSFEVATIERTRSGKDSWKIQRRSGEAYLYEERLGKALSLEMVAIPSGTFVMGAPEDESESSKDERPQHAVKLEDFYVSRYPVTQKQWRFVATLPSINQELGLDPSRVKGDARPVEQVSWFGALEFCKRLSQFTNRAYRLPSEAEWEYACRAGTTTPFHFGETISPDLANYYSSNSYNGGPKRKPLGETTPVDHFGIANAFGLSDMHGNVYEWCADHWQGNYEGAPTDSSAWLTEHENYHRMLRGGAWDSYPEYCRSAYRIDDAPAHSSHDTGFRVVCSAPRTL
ncbi:formylglycine-generating enzyme family protein [Trichocoleus sp. FACHB-262]|nr:formylglycine-generating enzyme family protein [Trichocoleus sp. FACHB-262]